MARQLREPRSRERTRELGSLKQPSEPRTPQTPQGTQKTVTALEAVGVCCHKSWRGDFVRDSLAP